MVIFQRKGRMDMDFLRLMQTRYTTKYYNPEKHIPEDVFQKILECARLTPSAVNIQPWHFITLESSEAKDQIFSAVPDFNRQRFKGCDKVIVLCAKTGFDKDFCARLAAKEVADGYAKKSMEADIAAGVMGYAKNRQNYESSLQWASKQVYLAMATILYAAAAYGVDSTPVEGVDIKKVDELLSLPEKGLNCLALVLLGCRSDTDSNTLDKRPKTRFDAGDILTRMK
jgi:nitroreductase/dihydropteridine reductase